VPRAAEVALRDRAAGARTTTADANDFQTRRMAAAIYRLTCGPPRSLAPSDVLGTW
jgi:hypothetical protein